MPSIVNATTTAGVAVSGDNSGVLALQTNNGTTAVTIDTSQNVGIGTASPATKLHVSGSGGDIVTLTKCTGGGGAGIFRADGDGAGSYPGFVTAQSGTNYWSIGQRGDTNLYLTKETGSGNVIIPSSGLKIVSTMGVGNANPATTGAGITFPATQSASSDANTLDDYEEGTWTPTIGASTTLPTSVTYVTQTGRYTKIGRMVSIQGRLQISAISGGVGNFAINGLPFANSANIVGAGLSWFSAVNLSAGYTTAGLYFAGNDAFLSLAESGDNVGANQLSIGTIGATFDIAFAFTYQV